jgi:hypothetical protein
LAGKAIPVFEMAFISSNADMLNVEETTLASMPLAECIRDIRPLHGQAGTLLLPSITNPGRGFWLTDSMARVIERAVYLRGCLNGADNTLSEIHVSVPP